MAKLTISIVNFNSASYLTDCLESIKSIKDEAEITTIVVDNASTDNSLQLAQEKFPEVKYIKNSENVGFGRAHNQVLRNLKTEFVLILNPDIRLKQGNISQVIEGFLKNPDWGAVSGKIIFENGQMDLTAHRGFPTPFASLLYFLGNDRLYHLTDRDMSKIHEVDAITGAYFMTKGNVLEKVGVFDEDYFMYAEDIDLCYRIKHAGFKIMFMPEVEILHFKGISSGLKRHSLEKTTADLETRKRSLKYFYETMKIFYKKHYEGKYPFFINFLVYLAIDIKAFIARRKLVV